MAGEIDMAFGSIYISSASETTVSSANTPYKAAGTTAALQLFNFTMPANNRLTYVGNQPLYFMVQVNISATKASGTASDIQYHVAKNDTLTNISVTRNTSSSAEGAMAVGGVVYLTQNDYVEIYVENLTNTDNLTVQEGTLSAFMVG